MRSLELQTLTYGGEAFFQSGSCDPVAHQRLQGVHLHCLMASREVLWFPLNERRCRWNEGLHDRTVVDDSLWFGYAGR